MAGGIFSRVTAPMGKVMVRNSILHGSFIYTGASEARVLPVGEGESCSRTTSISTAAAIERCANGQQVPILTYMAKCASGEFTDCMTIRNNRMVVRPSGKPS